MKYIKWQDGKLTCTHSKVERVWQTATDTRLYETDPPAFRSTTHLLMKDGARKDFIDKKESFDEADKYLKSID